MRLSREQFQRLALLTIVGLLALLATDRLMATVAHPFHAHERLVVFETPGAEVAAVEARIMAEEGRMMAAEARMLGEEARRMGEEARRHAERLRHRLEDHREGFRCDVDVEHEFDRDVRVVVR